MSEKITCPFCEANITLKDLRAGMCACGATIEENSKGEICFSPAGDSFSKGRDSGIEVDIKKKTSSNENVINSAESFSQGGSELERQGASMGLKIVGTTLEKCESYSPHIRIPYGVKTIAKEAFKRCKSMTSVDIPSSVERINEFAFMSCTGLKEVFVPASVRTMSYSIFFLCNRSLVINVEHPSRPAGWKKDWKNRDLGLFDIDLNHTHIRWGQKKR